MRFIKVHSIGILAQLDLAINNQQDVCVSCEDSLSDFQYPLQIGSWTTPSFVHGDKTADVFQRHWKKQPITYTTSPCCVRYWSRIDEMWGYKVGKFCPQRTIQRMIDMSIQIQTWNSTEKWHMSSNCWIFSEHRGKYSNTTPPSWVPCLTWCQSFVSVFFASKKMKTHCAYGYPTIKRRCDVQILQLGHWLNNFRFNMIMVIIRILLCHNIVESFQFASEHFRPAAYSLVSRSKMYLPKRKIPSFFPSIHNIIMIKYLIYH